MTQLGLLELLVCEAPARRASPRRAAPHIAASPAVTLALDVVESVDYDDGPGTTVAGYSLSMRNPFFGEWIRAGIWVTVERHFGWKPHRWMAEVYMEFPNEGRAGWKAHEIFETQDEAAKEAADMLLAARSILEAHLRGEPIETPRQRFERAAEAHADASPQWQHMQSLADAERAVRDSIDPDNSEKFYAHRRYLAAKDAANATRRNVLDEFYRAHSWREFAEVPSVAR